VTLRQTSDGPDSFEDDRLRTYYWMRLTRTFDDRMVSMWKQGRGLGGTFSQRGHEAIGVGAGLALGRPSEGTMWLPRCIAISGVTWCAA
jgi:TPP-dependent pyruvate/acetoin dehydrogenase alpha subunit